MSKAADEISHYREYDYILVNRDIDVAVAQVKAILQAERLRRDRQVGLTNFVKKLRAGLLTAVLLPSHTDWLIYKTSQYQCLVAVIQAQCQLLPITGHH